MIEIENLWTRLERWARSNAPEMLSGLNPGASGEEIDQLEAKVNLTLPDALKSSLSIHNGEDDGSPSKVFAEFGAYLSTSQIAVEWAQRQNAAEQGDPYEERWTSELVRDGIISVSGPVVPMMYCNSWLPIMECNGDIFWALDFSPAEGGVAEQLIEVDWEGCSWKVIASSFEEFMGGYVGDLESGRYRIEDGRPTKTSEEISRALLDIEVQPTLDDLRLLSRGETVELVVAAMPDLDESGDLKIQFKIRGGTVLVTGQLSALQLTDAGHYKIKAIVSISGDQPALDVLEFQKLDFMGEA
jgi:cell wall assembly regulator SMI1